MTTPEIAATNGKPLVPKPGGRIATLETQVAELIAAVDQLQQRFEQAQAERAAAIRKAKEERAEQLMTLPEVQDKFKQLLIEQLDKTTED